MDWWDTTTSTINGLRAVQISLGADVEHRAAALESTAQRDLLLFVLLALGTVAALGALALDCVRSVSAPLAELAQQAREVAGERLPRAVAAVQDADSGESPEPPAPLTVPRRAGAEVREVAEAFDRVQRAAFDLATEQAVLRRNATDSLVSLGRRNQNLVRRQISFINKLSTRTPTRPPSPTSSNWTTSPPECAATPRASSCSPGSPALVPGPPRWPSPTCCAPRSPRSRSTAGSPCAGSNPRTSAAPSSPKSPICSPS
jgi:hypothetical protein